MDTHRASLPARRRPGVRRAARVVAAVLAVFAALLGTAGPSSAHAVLVGSDPRDGANLSTAPTQVSVTFDEAVGLRPGYLRVIDGTGRRVDTGAAFHPAGHDDMVTVHLRTGLGEAAYLASYRVVSADSHPISGAVRFTVGAAAPVAARPGGNTTDPVVSAVFDVARSVTFLGLALLGGAWLLALGRWRRRGPGVGPNPAGDPSAGWRTVGAGAIFALVGLGAEFALQGPYSAGDHVTAALHPALLGDTLSLPFGRWHVAAIVLTAALGGAVLRLRRRRPDLSPGLAVLAAVAWVAVLTAVAESGHAGVRSPVWLGLPVTVVHLLAVCTWIGGLAVLATVVLPTAGRASHDGAAQSVLPVFSRVAMVCVAALAGTGTYQAWQEVGSWSALFGTTYGELVLTKIELFAVLVALGALARSRVAAWPGVTGDGGDRAGANAAAAKQLRTGVLLELAIAVAVLGVSGVLVAEPPGRDTATASPPSTSGVVTAQLSATRSVTVHVSPPRHGPVTIDVTVSVGPPVQRLTVAAAQNTAGVGPLPVTVHQATAAGVYLSAPVELPVAGDWQFTITVQTSVFDIATATPTVRLT